MKGIQNSSTQTTEFTRLSFWGVTFIYLSFNIILLLPFIYLIYDLNFFSSFNLTKFQQAILSTVFFLWLPIFSFPLLFELLPFSTLDLTLKGISQTILHKVFFICTLPVLSFFTILGNLLFNSYNYPYPYGYVNLINAWTFGINLWLFFSISLWILISLILWEKILGKNTSHTLKFARELKEKRNYLLSAEFDQFLTDYKFNDNSKFINRWKFSQSKHIVSNRWNMIAFNIPMLFFMLAGIAGYIFGDFYFVLLMLIGMNFFIYLISYNMVKKNVLKLNLMKSVQKYSSLMFGQKDISGELFTGATFMNGMICVCWILLFRNQLRNTIMQILYLTSYTLMLIIIVVVLWSNQIWNMLIKNDLEIK